MKTKEEIDKLYHKFWNEFNTKYDDNLHYYSFVEEYTQCQEDMAEKKYSEKDIIWAIQEAYGHGRDEADDILFQQVEESIRVILKSLNKKDNE